MFRQLTGWLVCGPQPGGGGRDLSHPYCVQGSETRTREQAAGWRLSDGSPAQLRERYRSGSALHHARQIWGRWRAPYLQRLRILKAVSYATRSLHMSLRCDSRHAGVDAIRRHDRTPAGAPDPEAVSALRVLGYCESNARPHEYCRLPRSTTANATRRVTSLSMGRWECRITRCLSAEVAGMVASGAPIVEDVMACPGLYRWPFFCAS